MDFVDNYFKYLANQRYNDPEGHRTTEYTQRSADSADIGQGYRGYSYLILE